MKQEHLASVFEQIPEMQASQFLCVLDLHLFVEDFSDERVLSLIEGVKTVRIVSVGNKEDLPEQLQSRLRELMNRNPNIEIRFASPQKVGQDQFGGEMLLVDNLVFIIDDRENEEYEQVGEGFVDMHRFAFEIIWKHAENLF